MKNITFYIILLVSTATVGFRGPQVHSPVVSYDIHYLDREKTLPLDAKYNSFFDQLASKFSTPEEDWVRDPFMFINAQKIIVARGLAIYPKIKKVLERTSLEMVDAKDGLKLPANMFISFHYFLQKAFRERLGLTPKLAKALAQSLEKEAVETAGVNYKSYIKISGHNLLPDQVLKTKIAKTLEVCAKHSEIDNTTDVPYVAGYSLLEPWHIFIDQSIPLETTINGYYLPIGKLLNIHEMVEKALLDQFGSIYQHAHQIALRVEKLSALAVNIDWTKYDDVMVKLIADLGTGDKVDLRVSPVLDLEPYYSYLDDETAILLNHMHESRKKFLANKRV